LLTRVAAQPLQFGTTEVTEVKLGFVLANGLILGTEYFQVVATQEVEEFTTEQAVDCFRMLIVSDLPSA
jgi:hypothetical protein